MFSLGCVFLEIATVLAGRQVPDLFDNIGHKVAYQHGIERCFNWIKELKDKSPSGAALCTALPWIGPLLRKDMTVRPRSTKLLKTMKDSTEGHLKLRQNFFCSTC